MHHSNQDRWGMFLKKCWKRLGLLCFIWHNPVSAHKKIEMKEFTREAAIKPDYFSSPVKIYIFLIWEGEQVGSPLTTVLSTGTFSIFQQSDEQK